MDGASSRGSGDAAIGGILRDSYGTISIRFSKSLGLTDSNKAKLMAIREVFHIFCKSSYYNRYKLWIESDSMNAVY